MASDSSSSYHDRDWANLLREVLTLIAKRLPPLDYANFSNVCKPWASVASPENGMPAPLPLGNRQPYLLLPGEDGEQIASCTLLDVWDDNRCYTIESLPEIRGKWCVGSQFGWLALIDEFSNPSLLNPFTRSQIDLPPVTTLPKLEPIYDSDGCTLSAYLHDPPLADDDEHEAYNNKQPISLEEFRERFSIHKLVLSSDPSKDGNFAAAALLGYENVPIFTRPAEGKWNIVWDREIPEKVIDAICYDGKFLLVTGNGNVYAVDLIDLRLTSFVSGYDPVHYGDARYLLDTSGVLVQVYRSAGLNEDKSMFVTDRIEVRSLHPRTGMWIPMRSLGHYSFFVGTCGSVSVLALEVAGLKANCIYFTDDDWATLIWKKQMVRDIGVFNLSDGSIEIYYPPDGRLTWPPPTWLMPHVL